MLVLKADKLYLLMTQINVLNYKWLEFAGASFQDIVTFHAGRQQIDKINDVDASITLGLDGRKLVFSGL